MVIESEFPPVELHSAYEDFVSDMPADALPGMGYITARVSVDASAFLAGAHEAAARFDELAALTRQDEPGNLADLAHLFPLHQGAPYPPAISCPGCGHYSPAVAIMAPRYVMTCQLCSRVSQWWLPGWVSTVPDETPPGSP